MGFYEQEFSLLGVFFCVSSLFWFSFGKTFFALRFPFPTTPQPLSFLRLFFLQFFKFICLILAVVVLRIILSSAWTSDNFFSHIESTQLVFCDSWRGRCASWPLRNAPGLCQPHGWHTRSVSGQRDQSHRRLENTWRKPLRNTFRASSWVSGWVSECNARVLQCFQH